MQRTTRRSLRTASRSPLLGNLHHTTHIPHIAPAWKKSTLLGTLVCLSQLSKPTLFFRCIAGIVTFLIQFCDINILGTSYQVGVYKRIARIAATYQANRRSAVVSTTFADRTSAVHMVLVASRDDDAYVRYSGVVVRQIYCRRCARSRRLCMPRRGAPHQQYQEWIVYRWQRAHLLRGALQARAVGRALARQAC
jgi:hypothetical protein